MSSAGTAELAARSHFTALHRGTSNWAAGAVPALQGRRPLAANTPPIVTAAMRGLLHR